MNEHPKLRDIEILPVMQGKNKVLVLQDPTKISMDSLTLPYKSIMVIKFLNGLNDIRDIQTQIMRETGELIYSDDISKLVELLDKHYFLDNENYHNKSKKIKEEFKNNKIRKSILAPDNISGDCASLRKSIEDFFTLPDSSDQIQFNASDDLLEGIISPHIDFERGGACYSYVLKEIAEKCKKRKFLVLGTAHNYSDSFFSFTFKDFETPLGIAKINQSAKNNIIENLGESITNDEFIHVFEHSIEFQVLLLQYLFQDDPDFSIIPILCGNLQENIHNMREPLEIPEYRKVIDTLKELVISENMCVIAGADLSHIGPRFRDSQQVSSNLLEIVRQEDNRVLETIQKVDPSLFFSSIAKIRNKFRICGFAPILAQLYIIGKCKGVPVKYCQAKDPYASVTFTAFSFYKK